MGDEKINVAYEGTFGDLSSAGAAAVLESTTMDFDLAQFAAGLDGGFTAINGGATVSPKDVFNLDSVPPSTAFTNLTTPGSTLMDTPDEDYQTSPLFDDLAFGPSAASEDWYSLFPEDTTQISAAAPVMARTSSSGQIVVHPGGEGNPRKRSSATASPAGFGAAVRHSSVAGVKPRKRDLPLPPIVVSEDDPTALKRARNTAAARKSRAKKVEERDCLKAEIADLKAQVEHWKALALGKSNTAHIKDE